jgi:hypothetical protein
LARRTGIPSTIPASMGIFPFDSNGKYKHFSGGIWMEPNLHQIML